MIGRLYVWRGQTWRVLLRWGSSTAATWACERCGRIRCSQPERRSMWHVCKLATTGTTMPMRRVSGPKRNVLLERVVVTGVGSAGGVVYRETGEQVCRPFRGLRRYRPPTEAA